MILVWDTGCAWQFIDIGDHDPATVVELLQGWFHVDGELIEVAKQVAFRTSIPVLRDVLMGAQ